MEINPIYKFMKDNGLTQKDEATFVSEYSNPQKSAELHKFMTDNGLTTKGADDFYSEYFAGSKKKEPTTPGSSQPAKPSTPSFGQKVTEKITNSASQTQIPLKTGLQVQEEKKAAEKQAKIPTSKYFEVDVEEKQDEAQAPKFADPIVVAKNSQKSKAIFNSVIGDKDIYKMPTPGESKEYASDITSGYLDYLELVGSDKSDTYKEKYKTLKAKSKEERTDQDEKFLRQVEAEAVGAFYDAKEWELGQVSKQIDDLQKTAVTDEQKAQLNNLYGQYEKKRNSLLGTSSVYAQNKLQYGKIAGTEMADEEAKLRRFEALQAGDGKTIEFFKGIGGAVANGVLSIGQVPKVFGDLIGDTDYDWSDEFYDMLSGQKSDLDREFGAPLPQGKNMTDLPFSARLAVVGGNAIGSAGLFAAGGGLVGATTNLGKAAATFGTAFLTSESGYYQEALEAGMSPQQAALAGTYLAAQTALIESIIPDVKYFEPSAFRKSVMQAVSSGIKSGLPVKEAAKLALKNTIKAIPESAVAYGKTGIKEAGEELLGQVGEDVGKVALNAAGERQYFNDTFNPESYTDAILGGFIAGGGMSVFSRPTPKSPVQEDMMREIVDRRDIVTKKGTASDKIGSKEDLTDFNDAVKTFDAMSSHSGWSQMSREEQNHAFAVAQQVEVMKKEQERMKELRIPDERKDAEIKRLEDEVNQMFSMQMERDKEKAKDAKIKAIEDEFNKSMEGEEFPVQEDERDQEIVELQKQREERGINELDTFLSDMKPMVPFAVERTEQGLPVAQSVKQAASNYLYKKYKELTDMKSDPNRMMTRGQIASVQKQLEQDIRTLEGTAETKTEARDQENIPGIPSQVREGQEPIQAKPVEVPSAEAPEAGRVLQAQEEVTPEAAPEVVVKPSRRERLAKMFETSDGEIAAEKVASFLGEANIGVEVLDPKSFEETGKQRNFEGDADGIFLVDNNTGKIYLNKERIKGAEGKTIAFHEGIHPVVNIIRNTNPKLYSAIVDGLKAEAVKNAGVAQAAADVAASEYYQEQGPSAIEDETVVETMARVAAGDIDIDTFEPSFREKFIEFMNKLAKMLGLKPIAVNSPRMEVKRLADQLSKALNEGGKLSDVVGKENISNYQNNIPIPGVIASGQMSGDISRTTDKPISVYQEKGIKKLPVKTQKEIYDKYGGKAVVINSDPTRVGELTLPSGKKIFMYGGPAYLSIEDNAKNNIGFATTQEGKVSSWKKYVDSLFGNKPGVTLVATQAPTSIMSNSYALRYVLDAISQLPKSVLKSSQFKNEFFGKDVVLLKDSFGEKKYKEFIDKYKKADLTNPEVIDNMISEMSYTVGNNNASASFKARGSFVANLLGGLGEKSSRKGLEGEKGYYSKEPQKYIAGQLMSRLGINAEKLIRDIGEPSIVDLYMNEGKWGFAVSGFETDPSIDIQSVQDLGIEHPLFNAKFPGKDAFLLDGAYEIDAMFKPIEMTGPKGAPYTKRASQMLAGSMYVKGGKKQGEQMFEYKPTVPSSVGVGRVQPSKGIKRGENLVKDTYYESGLTEDKNDYIFFHVSSAPEASIRKGIDSTKYTSLRTAREEKGLQYGVASYYTRPEDGERMVGGEKYAVRVPKAKVYPIDSDPLGYGEKAEAKIPQGTPFRGEAVKREIADMAKKNGYEMIVGEWSYSRTGKPAGELPEFRADALVPLKPTKEKPDSFTSNAEKGMERIPFPSQQSEQAKQELESIASEVRDIMSSKKKFSSKEYQLADSVYMSGQVTENKYEDNEFKRDITPEEYDMMTKVLPKSMQADAARVRGLLFGGKVQASIRIPRNVKQFSDNVSETVDRIKTATSEDGATLNLDGSTYEDGGLVVPAGSINVAQDDVSAEGLFEFLKDNEGNISSDIFKIGLYKFPDRPEVSYDLNIVIPREYRDVALKFGELAGQESLFDLDTFENIKTGSDGKNPRKFTAQELAEIAKDLSEGRLPKIVGGTAQPSMVKRTSAEVQRLMEDSMDSVDEAIADGVDAQTAVEDNITSQDWYSELTPKQKEQFDEIIKDEFGVTPKAPVAKPTGVKATIANIIDNYYKLKDGDRSARVAINEILGQDPKLKYIYDNISKINKQLQDAGVITDKTDGCP